MPSARLRTALVVVVCLGAVAVTAAGVINADPNHRLEGVAVNTATNEPARVQVQVYAAAGDRLVADRTVTVEGAAFDLSGSGNGTATGTVTAGETTVTEGWSGSDNYVVRARQPGRTEWSRVALGPADRANDPSWVVDLLRRYDLDDDCFGVRVTVTDSAASGGSASPAGCAAIDG